MADFSAMLAVIRRVTDELQEAGWEVDLRVMEVGKTHDRFHLRTNGYLSPEERAEPMCPDDEPDTVTQKEGDPT